MSSIAVLPPFLLLDSLLSDWLREDLGRGDRTTSNLLIEQNYIQQAEWIAKEGGVIAGLPIAKRVFELLSKQMKFVSLASEGEFCHPGQTIARLQGPFDTLLMGERVALNLVMHLSGIASLTRKYVEQIAGLPTQLVDTRKTTPGLRLLEKYASQVGGAMNHRMGLDDAVMIKDNHIAVAGGISQAIDQIRGKIPYPLTIEVETETLEQVQEALHCGIEIIMLDNMSPDVMGQAVQLIRQNNKQIKIEASGNITLETIRLVAETGVDFISSSAPITRSTWLDLSMKLNT